MPPLRALPWRRWLLRSAALAAACALGGLLAGLFPPFTASALTWPVVGIALAGLVRWGPQYAPAVLLGAGALQWSLGLAPLAATALALGQTGAAGLAAVWLRRQGFNHRMEQRRDLALLLTASAGAGLLSAAAAALWFGLGPAGSSAAALPRWLADTLGCLVAGVPLLAWSRRAWAPALAPARLASTFALSAATLASAWAAFFAHTTPAGYLTPLVFVPHVLLCWLAMRSGLLAASVTVAVFSAGAVWASAAGWGPFQPALAGPAMLWGYVASLCAIALLVHALAGELAHLEERWQLALEGSDLGVADWNLRGGTSYTSPRWRSLLVDADGLLTATPAAWLERAHQDDRARLRAALAKLGRGQDSFRLDLRLLTGPGWAWFETRALVAERSANGEPTRLVVSVADISRRRTEEERQRLSASLFQHLHEGLLITDAELRVLDVNPTYSQIMGVSRHELLGSVPGLLAGTAADPATQTQQSAMWASLRATGTWRGEVVERRRNGEACTLQVTISSVRDAEGQARNHVLVISDITEQRLQRERLERQAHFDELTRLPNRSRLSQMLADAMAACDREGCLLAVCYLDLDHFKPVNDRFGHAAGDRLLVELALRLRGALRSNAAWSDSAARLGGDEFVLLLRAGTLDEARLAVERVLRVIALPYLIDADTDPVQVTGSVGATVYPLDRSDADTLLRHADHAMYSAKQSGRNGYLFFDPEHNRRTEERVTAIGRVQEALDERELLLYYQPKVDMRRGVVLGMEALLRWNHPEHGLIAPLQFLPLIEHTGLSARIGDWVLEQALDQLAHWQRMGLDLSVSVNVSARHLQEPDFAQRLAELLARQKRPLGPKLELEVLETAALADVDYTSALLERCRKLGARFALDDFGTGYSTLTYLKRLPVDVLKIDRSFVRNMLDDRQDLAIVQGVVGLARTFDCDVVAEGVESPAQARLLIEMGCDIGQGHGIASPMPANDVFRWVSDYRGPFALSAAAVPPVGELPVQRAGPP